MLQLENINKSYPVGKTRLEVLKHADKALYRAKRKGRNRVEF